MKTKMHFLVISFLVLMNCLNSFAAKYFVTTSGAGFRSGESWENALSNDELIQLFDGTFLEDGDSVFVAAGVYTTKGSAGGNGNPTAMLYCTSATSIFGGYPNGLAGADIRIDYPSIYETVFSGDLRNEGVANESCSSNVLYYSTENKEVEIKGISFAYCFHSGANNLTGYNFDNTMSDANGFGALVLEQTNATLEWCKFYNNATPPATDGSVGTKYYGGALNVQSCELVHIKDCVFSNNYAARCGAAIGIKSPDITAGQSPSSVLIQRTLFDQNSLSTAFSGRYGGAIAINSIGYCYIVNSTFARAKYFSNGGALSGDVGASFFIISSTFAENDDYYYYTNSSTGGSYGYNLRGNNSIFRLANTINVNNRIDKYGYSIANGISHYNKVGGIYNEGFTSGDQIKFSGYNLTGVSGTVKADTTADYSSTDLRKIYYEDVFNKTYNINDISSTSLAPNGGFSMTMKPANNHIGMPQSEFINLKTSWNVPDKIWNLIDYTVDQRGYIRSTTQTSRGAFDVNGVAPISSFVKSVSRDSDIMIREVGKNKYVLEGTSNMSVNIYASNGYILQAKKSVRENEILDFSQFAAGIYVIKANTKTFKVVK